MNNFDTTDIEQAFGQAMEDAGVTSLILNNRPKAKLQTADFAVVRVGYDVTDLAAYGTCSVRIALYARDVDNLKNGVKLGVMYDKLIAGMPMEIGRYLVDPNPIISPDIADDYGFHARIVTFRITIKAV
ncbi:MAG: hypothetical protein J6U51_07510 [Bacteroidales bacterium]|nr:hypothetical protein [Bacteroidales bacterium]